MPGELTMNSLPCTMSVSIRTTSEVITAWVKSKVTRHSWVRSSMRAGTGQRPSRTYRPPRCSTTRTSLPLAAGAIGRSAVSSANSPSVRAESALSSRVSSSSALSRPSPPATRSASTTRSRSACDARRSGRSFDMAATLARQTVPRPTSRQHAQTPIAREVVRRRSPFPAAHPGQVGGADDASVLAELRDSDLGQRPATAAGQRALEGGPRGIEQRVARLGHAAADHEAGRIEDRGQVGQPLAEPAAHDLEAAQRGRVALGRGLGYHRAGNALRYSPAQLQQADGSFRRAPGELTRLGDQRVPAAVLLPAAAVPAAAQPPVGHHPDVAGLTRHPPAAAVELAADQDGGPDTGPQGDQHHVAVAAGRAEPGLAPGRSVRVILH